MIRKCFVMQLNRGAEEEYRRRHDPIWNELEETLRAHGVHNYSIFLHPETRQLFAYAEIEEEARWNAIASDAGLPTLVGSHGRSYAGKCGQFAMLGRTPGDVPL